MPTTTTTYTIDQLLTQLSATPQRLTDLTATATCTLTQLHTRPTPDEWSPNEILAHLRACADVWGRSISRLLTEDTPTFRYLSPRTYLKKTNYLDLDFPTSLHTFTTQRTHLITLLASLPPTAWTRSATVIKSGKSTTQTVHLYAETLLTHELSHLDQLTHCVQAARRLGG